MADSPLSVLHNHLIKCTSLLLYLPFLPRMLGLGGQLMFSLILVDPLCLGDRLTSGGCSVNICRRKSSRKRGGNNNFSHWLSSGYSCPRSSSSASFHNFSSFFPFFPFSLLFLFKLSPLPCNTCGLGWSRAGGGLGPESCSVGGVSKEWSYSGCVKGGLGRFADEFHMGCERMMTPRFLSCKTNRIELQLRPESFKEPWFGEHVLNNR